MKRISLEIKKNKPLIFIKNKIIVKEKGKIIVFFLKILFAYILCFIFKKSKSKKVYLVVTQYNLKNVY